MKKPLVSIIVPVFNTEKYLPDCLSSILNQDFSDFELILVDNGSTDNSVDICKEYEQKDSRVKLFVYKKEQGAAQARNYGLSKAEGEYIAFIDSDDVVAKDYLSFLFNKSKNGSYDLVSAKHAPFNKSFAPKASAMSSSTLSSSEAVSHLLTQKIPAGPVCKLYKASLLSGLRFEDFAVGEDLFLNYNYFKKCSTIIASDKIIYGYRNNTESLTKKRFNMRRMDGLVVTQKIAESENYSISSVIRLFMEAYFILEIIDISHEADKYPKEAHQCKQILKKYHKKVLFAKESTKKQRFIALFSFFGAYAPAKIINFLKRRAK